MPSGARRPDRSRSRGRGKVSTPKKPARRSPERKKSPAPSRHTNALSVSAVKERERKAAEKEAQARKAAEKEAAEAKRKEKAEAARRKESRSQKAAPVAAKEDSYSYSSGDESPELAPAAEKRAPPRQARDVDAQRLREKPAVEFRPRQRQLEIRRSPSPFRGDYDYLEDSYPGRGDYLEGNGRSFLAPSSFGGRRRDDFRDDFRDPRDHDYVDDYDYSYNRKGRGKGREVFLNNRRGGSPYDDDRYEKGKGKGKGRWGGKGRGGGKGDDGDVSSTRVHVTNVPQGTSEGELNRLFSKHGEVLGLQMLGGGKGAGPGMRCAIIRFVDNAGARASIDALHNHYEVRPGDAPLLVKLAKPNPRWDSR